MSHRIAIIGAGLAGAAAGQRFAAAGHAVRLFDKGRGAGGRLAIRRATLGQQTIRFDHGAPAVPRGSGAFSNWVSRALSDGDAAAWAGPAAPGGLTGAPGMKQLVVHALAGLHVAFGVEADRLDRRRDGWWIGAGQDEHGPFEAVLVTVPAPQVPRLVAAHDLILTEAATSARYHPCWTGMLAFAESADDAVRAAEGHHAGADLTMIADHAKPGRDGPPRLVIHAGPERAVASLEAEKDHMAAEFAREAEATGCFEPTYAAAHRWRFSRVSRPTVLSQRWGADGTLGVAGDWTAGPNADDAFNSGADAADAFLRASG